MEPIQRRHFLQLLGVGGAVFASGLAGCAGPGGQRRSEQDDFYFVQLSDTHWGYSGPPNPEAETTLPLAIERVNRLQRRPDFVVFTGDLTHTTDDPAERRRRMATFRGHADRLQAGRLHFLAGEHDASIDRGEAYQERFGPLHWSFDHKGVHFVGLDNVSDPAASLGPDQLDWLARDLQLLSPEAPIVVFTHRPLFDLQPTWDWTTKDGSKAIDLLSHHKNVTVFYGHIHQEHHQKTLDIEHHAARSLIFPLPAPGSVPKRAPIPWDAAHPRRGLGWVEVSGGGSAAPRLAEVDLGEERRG